MYHRAQVPPEYIHYNIVLPFLVMYSSKTKHYQSTHMHPFRKVSKTSLHAFDFVMDIVTLCLHSRNSKWIMHKTLQTCLQISKSVEILFFDLTYLSVIWAIINLNLTWFLWHFLQCSISRVLSYYPAHQS